MDPVTIVLAGCMAYGGYSLYKSYTSPFYSFYVKDVKDDNAHTVHTFKALRTPEGTLNIDQITSDVILINKPKLVDTVKCALSEYGQCSGLNSFLFYYGEVPVLKIVIDNNASKNVIVRLSRTQSWFSNRKFTIITNKQYNFESPISETCDVVLSENGSLEISPYIYNYPIIVHETTKSKHNFSHVSELIFTYYNIPVIRLKITGQEDQAQSLVMDMA
jgi:hypothetical protein